MTSPDPAAGGHLDRSALGSRVTDLFRAQVTDGAWPVGSKIPVEAELVAWSGAGRNTVREAIGSLVQAGLLRREQGRGTFVVSTSDVSASMSRRAASIPRREGLELRLVLDAAAARIAAGRRDEADVTTLLELVRARQEAWASGDEAARVQADSALHLAVVRATHNTLLVEVYAGLLSVFEEVLVDDVASETDHLAQLHQDLVDAIVAQDGTGAADTMSALLQPMIDELG